MKIEIKREYTERANNPLLRNNGGDYDFYEETLFINNEKIGVLFGTSAQFDYCEVTGNFTDCRCLNLDGTDFYISVNTSLAEAYEYSINIEELKTLLK
jgi:hypothetical protein